jgi:hypothetical protein
LTLKDYHQLRYLKCAPAWILSRLKREEKWTQQNKLRFFKRDQMIFEKYAPYPKGGDTVFK